MRIIFTEIKLTINPKLWKGNKNEKWEAKKQILLSLSEIIDQN